MRRRATISLTPLIDVVFILLVFFMLATSFTNWRTLELGVTKTGGRNEMKGTILVELRKDGLRLSGRTVSNDTLIDKLASQFKTDPDQAVLIKPEAGVVLQQAVDLAEQISAAGGRKVSFLSAPTGTR